MRTRTHARLALRLILISGAAAALAVGCEAAEGTDFGLRGSGAPGELGGAWQTDTTYSPTGTTLVPGGQGYDVVDEVCGARDDAGYADRFLTPMFRDIAVVGDLAYVVDGSHLWVLDVSEPEAPTRLSVQKIAGHPVAVHRGPWRLWIATIDAGLRGYPVAADGAVSTHGEQVLFADAARVMDIDGAGDVLFAALGADGVAAIRPVDPARKGATPEVRIYPAAPYAAAVDAAADRVSVAACDRAWSFRRGEGRRDATTLTAQADLTIPTGNAKGVVSSGDDLFVSAGAALLAYRIAEDARYLGFYADNAAGFYVNEAVVGGGVLYLAAGDQSVRALPLDDLTLDDGVPVPASGDIADLDAPVSFSIEPEDVFSVPRDPIAIDIADGHIYALGNFRYLGERTVEILDVSVPRWLRDAGRYVQPNVATRLSRMGPQVLTHGPNGNHLVVDVAATTPNLVGAFDNALHVRGAVSEGDDVYLYGAGSVLRARQGGVAVELAEIAPGGVDAHGLALAPRTAYIADSVRGGILAMDRDSGLLAGIAAPADGFLGEAALHVAGDLLLAYDRVVGELRVFEADGAPRPLGRVTVGLCEAYDIADFYTGAVNAEARFLVNGSGDVALLCPRTPAGGAELTWLDLSDPEAPAVGRRTALPGGVYSDAALTDDALILTSFDNNRYESRVVACDVALGTIVAEARFSGHANAVMPLGDRVYVADGDFGLRAFDRALAPRQAHPLPLQ